MRGILVACLCLACSGQGEVSPTKTEATAPRAAISSATKVEVRASPPQPSTKVTPDAAPANAAPAAEPPSTLVIHAAPDGVEEVCQRLVAFPFTPDDVKLDKKAMRWYREDDFEEIDELCAISLYAAETTEAVTASGICPKTHWSTPALEVHALDKVGMTKAAFEKRRCKWDRRYRGAKKLAKFKVAVYYKEPQSALMYFHFSRLLGANSYIVPTTFRTVSRTQLAKWEGTAIATLKSRTLSRLNPLEGWSVLQQRHRKGADTIPGSFAQNARGEKYYKAFTFFQDMETRIGSVFGYRKMPYYKIVASKRPLEDNLTFDPESRPRFDRALQALATAQDFTHMLILDHLFNQRDRSGNINSRVRHHYVDDDDHLRWTKKPGDDSIALERLLLKDNDDGLRWDAFGMLNASLIIDEVRHLDSVTYERLQWLAKLVSDETTRATVEDYFINSVHVSSETFNDVRTRLIDLAKRLADKMAAGTLVLDLDLEPWLAKRRDIAKAAQ